MALRVLFLVMLSVAVAFVDGNNEVNILHNWREMLNDPNSVLQSWDPTLYNPCTWFHITCDSNNTVTRVDLGDAGLSGTISPLLGNLTNLQYLELYGNNFTGAIPASIGELPNLISLNLSQNLLSGSIPPSLGRLKSLRFLELFGNNLSGVIPAEIGKLTSLQRLDLFDNQISGSIPASLGNLTSLRYLRLQSNALTGQIPIEILELVRLGNLEILNVSKNNMTKSGTTMKSNGLAITTIIQDH